MNPSARVATAPTISVVLAAALPGPAAGDGLPAGERGARTLVGSTRLRGDWVVPVVAYGGSPGGPLRR